MMWKNIIVWLYTILIFYNPDQIKGQGRDSCFLSSGLSNEYCLEALNEKTPLELEYNTAVKKSIDYFLKVRKKDIEVYLGRSKYYFPIIEQALDKYNLPLELKYIAVLESGLNPFAKSPSGAVGLWQFLYNTCSLFDIQVDSYIDERRDPYKSTEAACRYLQYLYNTFNDWNLVLASYNGGPGEVRKAIERSGGKTGYWDLRPYLSKQASDYVPNLIAIIYLMNYYQQLGIVPFNDTKSVVETDSLHINYGLSFVQISEVLGIPMSMLEKLNPEYRKGYIPKLDLPCTLVLPKSLLQMLEVL
jgi:membrane-bound lytic murein transglycosylase D